MKRFVAALGVCVWVGATAGAQQKTLDVYWIDVEGGGATLIVTPAGESVLIDTGWPDERGAPRIQKVATEVARLRQIDHLIITHFHIDHFGGAAALAKLLPVRHVYDNGTPTPPPSDRDAAPFAEYTKAFEGIRTLLKPGDTVPLKHPGPTLRLVATRQQFAPRSAAARSQPTTAPSHTEVCSTAKEKDPDTSDNANSTVWVLESGRFRFFDGGDLTWNTEGRLVCPNDLVGAVDVYQTDHHGLAASNNPALVRTLAPTVTVMNNGPRKGGDPETITMLKAMPIEGRYQVHRDVRHEQNTEDDYIANLPEHCQANYIKMSVDPTGQRYTISIPATGHSKTFKARGT